MLLWTSKPSVELSNCHVVEAQSLLREQSRDFHTSLRTSFLCHLPVNATPLLKEPAELFKDTHTSLKIKGSYFISSPSRHTCGGVFCFDPSQQARALPCSGWRGPWHSLMGRPSHAHGKPRAPRGLGRTAVGHCPTAIAHLATVSALPLSRDRLLQLASLGCPLPPAPC